ncbi:MAG: cysteine rich repeat-containing protein [Steroidobacteraceae bacterium]
MTRLTLLLVCCAASATHYALADDAAALAALRAGCATDAQKLCAGVQPGGGRILACLKEHKDALSDQCKQAAAQAAGSSGNSAPAAPATPSAPPSAPAKSPPASAASSAAGRGAAAATGTASGSYLRMKKGQVVDPGVAGVQAAQPAIDLLIPSDWDLKGNVVFGGGKGGCFADLFAVSWEATNPDGSIAFQGAPNYSWQYTDDPAELRKLNDPQRRALGAGGKPCPVMKPMGAENYFRQNVLPNLTGGSTVISVEPFPELNQIARRQMGLPPTDAGNGGARTEAIRVRVESQKDGKPVEGWVALAVVTRVYPVGRGSFYDSHAIDFMALRTPKGKLDANDKLFKVMLSSVRLEPQWQAYSNATIAKFYKAEAQKEAMEDQMWAALQNKITQTILGVTANAERGAEAAAFGADQNIRGVQTFRDPTTGGTMELSNQYDHAWLNGSNEYIMSDDPNFNPNANLSGSWNQLQVVRPAP